ncbi:unnamed protein product, partial [marine sediment metagenome]
MSVSSVPVPTIVSLLVGLAVPIPTLEPLTNIGDNVGIGTTSPNYKLELAVFG